MTGDRTPLAAGRLAGPLPRVGCRQSLRANVFPRSGNKRARRRGVGLLGISQVREHWGISSELRAPVEDFPPPGGNRSRDPIETRLTCTRGRRFYGRLGRARAGRGLGGGCGGSSGASEGEISRRQAGIRPSELREHGPGEARVRFVFKKERKIKCERGDRGTIARCELRSKPRARPSEGLRGSQPAGGTPGRSKLRRAKEGGRVVRGVAGGPFGRGLKTGLGRRSQKLNPARHGFGLQSFPHPDQPENHLPDALGVFIAVGDAGMRNTFRVQS
jgi:hypothetical protein